MMNFEESALRSIQQSGPYCDACGHVITGIDGGLMDTWSMPSGLTLLNHDRCRDRMAHLKTAILQAYANDALSWLRWLMKGNTVTWDEINKSVTNAVQVAIDEFKSKPE